MDASINLNSNHIQRNMQQHDQVETAGSIAQAPTQPLFSAPNTPVNTASSSSSSSGGNFSAMA